MSRKNATHVIRDHPERSKPLKKTPGKVKSAMAIKKDTTTNPHAKEKKASLRNPHGKSHKPKA